MRESSTRFSLSLSLIYLSKLVNFLSSYLRSLFHSLHIVQLGLLSPLIAHLLMLITPFLLLYILNLPVFDFSPSLFLKKSKAHLFHCSSPIGYHSTDGLRY